MVSLEIDLQKEATRTRSRGPKRWRWNGRWIGWFTEMASWSWTFDRFHKWKIMFLHYMWAREIFESKTKHSCGAWILNKNFPNCDFCDLIYRHYGGTSSMTRHSGKCFQSGFARNATFRLGRYFFVEKLKESLSEDLDCPSKNQKDRMTDSAAVFGSSIHKPRGLTCNLRTSGLNGNAQLLLEISLHCPRSRKQDCNKWFSNL